MDINTLCVLFKKQSSVLFTTDIEGKIGVGIIGFLVCVLSKVPVIVLAVFGVWLIDFASGLFHAWSTNTINSKKGQQGLVKILLYILVILTGFILDNSIVDFFKFFPTVQSFWDIHHPFVQLLSGFIVVNDSISIFENTGKMGVPIPKAILKRLTDVKNNINNV